MNELSALVCSYFKKNFSLFKGGLGTVHVDSREVKEGCLFFALPGERTDGHLFLQDVCKKGAIGAVIQEDFQGKIPEGLPVIRVKDTLAALQGLARLKVHQKNPKVIGITGSLGKTTTKEFTKTLCESAFSVASTIKNQNSKIGLALSIVNSMHEESLWIVEMGMTHQGDITSLVDIIAPDIALVTCVTYVHAVNFHDLSDIARAKGEIFLHPKTKWKIVNKDTPFSDELQMMGHGKEVMYSMTDRRAHFSLQVLDDALVVYEEGKERRLPKPPFPAPHVFQNLLAAIAAARVAGVPYEGIEEAVLKLKLPGRRLEVATHQGISFINDSYNACELSMTAALDVLKSQKGRRIAVLGQMRELGRHSFHVHQRVGMRAKETADVLYCLGEESAPLFEEAKKSMKECFFTTSFEDLVKMLKNDLKEGDVVLLKGSRSNGLWNVLDSFQKGDRS